MIERFELVCNMVLGNKRVGNKRRSLVSVRSFRLEFESYNVEDWARHGLWVEGER